MNVPAQPAKMDSWAAGVRRTDVPIVSIVYPNPPMDPWASGVRAADVPAVEGGDPNPLEAPANGFEAASSPEGLTSLRLRLRSNGYHPVPVVGVHISTYSAGKRPTMNG